MQNVSTDQYANSSGWHVEHDINTQMYILRNERGNRLQGVYTTRRFAEKALADYLERLQAKDHRRKKSG